MAKKFIVHMVVNGRIDLEVEAENAQEAFEMADAAFEGCDLNEMDSVCGNPENVFDVETGERTY